jgi:quercetin dioxygenase-like cupin family protein
VAKRYVENASIKDLPREPWHVPGLPNGAFVQTLSEDPDTGALTAVIHLPAGWTSLGDRAAASAMQLFVLEGALRMGSNLLESGAYCYHPADSRQGAWHSLTPTRMLAIFEGKAAFGVGNYEPNPQSIPALDTWTMQWVDPLAASEPSVDYRTGVMVKVLRVDPDTGASTHLAGLLPGWFMPGLEVHPVYEENYCLSGDVHIGLVGDKPGYTMTEGVYLCRPPGIAHGPVLSKNGNVNFCYTHGRLGIDYRPHPEGDSLIRRHLLNYPWK